MIESAVVFDGSMSVARARAKASLFPDLTWCVVREESDGTIAWYVLDAGELLAETRSTEDGSSLADALDRHWHRAEVRQSLESKRLRPRSRHIVILDGTDLVGILPGEGHAVIPGMYRDWMPSVPPVAHDPARTPRFIAWPLVTAPAAALPNEQFILTIALSRERHGSAPPIAVELLEEGAEFDLDVDVSAIGFDAPSGWRFTLHVNPRGPFPVAFIPLRVRTDAAPGSVLIHAAFLHRGIVCGYATSAMTIGAGNSIVMPGFVSPCSFPDTEEEPADLVVLMRKADGNSSTGKYIWSMSSTRAVVDSQPLLVDLGEDSRTFARTLMRDIDANTLLEQVVRSIGKTIASYIPAAFWNALRAVADAVAPEGRPPAVLLYSAEVFIPWELALMEQPLGAGPPFLGAQISLGRWIPSQRGDIPASPSSSIPRRDLAVLAPDYSFGDLPKLQWAVAEAKHMVQTYGAIGVDATEDAVGQLLNAELVGQDGSPAEITVVHFACHGSTNPMLPGSAGLFLTSGKRLVPDAFGASVLGARFGPILFLNACETGMAQRLLDHDAGFAGRSLRGGFRAFIAPLWSVEDAAAAGIAHRFYEAVLDGNVSVGNVLRDIRCSPPAPNATPLAYVFYGHPRLRVHTET